MKDILIDGHRILTTDEVADAVIDYARVLQDHGRSDVVHFPSIHDGELSRCSMLLGSGLLGEALLPRHFAGMAAIFVGLALIDGRLAASWRAGRAGAPTA